MILEEKKIHILKELLYAYTKGLFLQDQLNNIPLSGSL
jgi:hypothetical protein